MLTHKPRGYKWGIYETKRHGVTVQIDVAPANQKGELVGGHVEGASCFCKPKSTMTKSEIPMFVHDRGFKKPPHGY
jgi:hypothetical protein